MKQQLSEWQWFVMLLMTSWLLFGIIVACGFLKWLRYELAKDAEYWHLPVSEK